MKDKCQITSVINYGVCIEVGFLVRSEKHISFYQYRIHSVYKYKIEIKYKKKPFKALNLCKDKGELIKKGRKKNEN